MKEQLLINYRSNPSNLNFRKIAEEYNSWLNATATLTLQKFPSLSKTSIDDLINEGLISMHKSIRRFMWICKYCGDAFIQLSDLNKHALDCHMTRGDVKLIKLSRFTEHSVKMTMKRSAIRMIKNNFIIDYELLNVNNIEDTINSEIVIRNAERKMTEDAKRILTYILSLSKPNKIKKYRIECLEIKNLLTDLSHCGY